MQNRTEGQVNSGPPARGRRTRLYSKAGRNDMAEVGKNLLLFLSALFPIVDPLGGSPIFLALTREYSQSARKTLSWRIAMNSLFLLVRSYLKIGRASCRERV